MRNRLLAVILSLCLLSGMAAPAYAAEISAEGSSTVAEDLGENIAPDENGWDGGGGAPEEGEPPKENSVPEESAPLQTDDNSATPENVLPVSEEPTLYADTSLGGNLIYDLDIDTGILAISGSGAMPDYTASSQQPWHGDQRYIEQVVIGEGVTYIGNYTFADCTALENVTVPSTVTVIGSSAFRGCSALKGISSINAVTDIGSFAFYNCTSLAEIALPGSLTSIGSSAFNGCTALQNLSIPETVRTIDGSAFSGCTKLQNVTVPGSVATLGSSVFDGCSSLRSVTLLHGITSIPYAAFWGCSRLEEITIPRTVTSIGSDAFYKCSRLRDVYYVGSKNQWSTVTGTSYVPVTVQYNAPEGGTRIDQKVSTSWKVVGDTLYISGFGNMTENYRPWYDQRTLIYNIVVEEGITAVSDNAFEGFSNLESVTIPNSVTSIGSSAFKGCSILDDVTIPNANARVWENAFENCLNLSTIALPQNLVELSSGIFRGCKKLPDPGIPASVASIGSSAFYNCTSLAEIALPGSLTSIGSSAFNGCTALQNLSIPETVRTIDGSAFSGCTKLQNVTVPGSVATLGSSVFDGCSSLRSVTLLHGITSIPYAAFYGCSRLEEITIPRTVTSIGSDAFYKCSGLRDVYYAGKEAHWGTITGTNYVPSGATIHYEYTESVVAVSAVALNKTSLTLTAGGTETLTATVSPTNATDKSVTWSSSNTSVATVSGSGVVTTVSAGTAIITVTTTDGKFTDTCTLTVPQPQPASIPVTGVTLNKNSMTMEPGRMESLIAAIAPANATDKSISWSTSNPDVATVSNGGVVTALRAGTATITVTTGDGGKTAVCVVSVSSPVAPTGITLNKTTLDLKINETATLIATVTPANAANKTVTWVSSNEAVVTVSQNGLVTAVAAGKETITATTAEGGKIAQCEVSITEPKILREIQVTNAPSTATQGEPLELGNMKVIAYYSDNSSAAVTDYSLSGYSSDQVGPQKITVTYQDKTATFTVAVEASALTGIAVTKLPDKCLYTVGDTFKQDGMTVTAYYGNSKSEAVNDYSVFPTSLSTAGTQTIEVTYRGFTATFSVEVIAAATSGTVATPRIGIESFIGGKKVTLTTATSNATIYYTTDGSAPTTSSKQYTGAITLTSDTKIKAMAVKSGMNNSKVASGTISVAAVAAPVASHAQGELPVGTIITLKSGTTGAAIYYTTDGSDPIVGSKPTVEYSGGIQITMDMTVKAIAVKSGCVSSGVYTIRYTVPQEARPVIYASVGSVTAAAGNLVSLPMYFFMDDGMQVDSFTFTLKYDEEKFDYKSGSSNVFIRSGTGEVTVLYTGEAMPSGEICTLNFQAVASATDGDYSFTVSNISATGGNNHQSYEFDVTHGTVTLSGSHNSNLEVNTVLTTAQGSEISSPSDVKNLSEVTANISLDGATEVANGTGATSVSMVTIILAVYGDGGKLVTLNKMEADLTNITSIFTHTIDIPKGTSVSSIKLMVMNSDYAPLCPVSALLS